jgi:hypothetical protein
MFCQKTNIPGCDAVSLSEYFATFRRIEVPSSSGSPEEKKKKKKKKKKKTALS